MEITLDLFKGLSQTSTKLVTKADYIVVEITLDLFKGLSHSLSSKYCSYQWAVEITLDLFNRTNRWIKPSLFFDKIIKKGDVI